MNMNINSNMTVINNYFGQPGMGGPMAMGQQQPMKMMQMMQMMQMMMQMMQMMMGGSSNPMMGGMPGMGDMAMGGGMPMGGGMGNTAPMLGNNLGNFLGVPPGNTGTPSGIPGPANGSSPGAGPAQQPPAAPNQQTPGVANPGGNKSGQKTGPPPGYKTMTGKIPPEVTAKAKSLLNQPMGTEIPFEANGKSYMARLETHYHPPGYVGGPNGYHKGVTVYEKKA